MSKLKQRTLSAALFAPIVLGSIYFSDWTFQGLWLFVSIVCAYELSSILDHKYGKSSGFSTLLKTTIPAIIFFAGIMYLNDYLSLNALLSTILICILIIFIHGTFADVKNPIKNIFAPVVTITYVSIPLVLLADLVGINGTYNNLFAIGLILLIWANDTGAYFVGSRLGKRKLAPEVSPNKTWEGFFGGLVLSIAVALLLASVLEFDRLTWGLLGLSAGVFGTLGDLFESSLKRYTGVKDSGNIMPGHGGLLDRFDGFFFLIPVAWIIQQLV